jgi:hypothetical protein
MVMYQDNTMKGSGLSWPQGQLTIRPGEQSSVNQQKHLTQKTGTYAC